MSDWKSLPSEVLNIIFLYLKKSDKYDTHKKDLSQCALTCRGWRDASQAVFFSDINMRAKNDLNKLFLLLLVNNNIRGLIKTLSFDGSMEHANDFAILIASDMQLPNLESLYFSGDNLLYSSFTKIVAENGSFKNLRRLPTPKNTEQDQGYLQCINSLKDRVTTIELFDDPTANRNSYSSLRERLNVFPYLEEIVVYTSTRNMYSEDFMQYLKFVAVMKLESLKKISIVSSCNNGYCFQLFTSGQQALFSTTEPKNIHVIIKNKVYTLPSNAFMFFIMKRFPNTDSFRLEHDFYENHPLVTLISTDLKALLPFLRYLSVMPNSSLQNIGLSYKTEFKLIKNFYTAIKKKPTSAKLLRRLKVRTITYGNNRSSSGVVPIDSYVSFQNINSREQNINITLNYVYSSQQLTQDNVSPYLHSSNEVQFQQLVQQVGRFLKMIDIEITPNSRFDTSFNTVLANCPQLNELVISGYKSLSEESFQFNKKSKKRCNIKILTLLGFTPTQRQLISLLDQLPNLEKLSLTNLFLRSFNPSQELSSICLPNASLKCLEVCIDGSFSGNLRHVIHPVKIVTEDPNQKTFHFSLLAFFSGRLRAIVYELEDITEDDYQYYLTSSRGGTPTCLLYCKSLENFTIRYLDESDRQWCYKKMNLLPASPP